jgi:hypothetical protein
VNGGQPPQGDGPAQSFEAGVQQEPGSQESPAQPGSSASYDAAPAPAYRSDAPQEHAAERDYGAQESRPAPIEADFDRGPPTDSWSPPAEPSYRDEPREPASADTPEAAPASSDERQAG